MVHDGGRKALQGESQSAVLQSLELRTFSKFTNKFKTIIHPILVQPLQLTQRLSMVNSFYYEKKKRRLVWRMTRSRSTMMIYWSKSA